MLVACTLRYLWIITHLKGIIDHIASQSIHSNLGLSSSLFHPKNCFAMCQKFSLMHHKLWTSLLSIFAYILSVIMCSHLRSTHWSFCNLGIDLILLLSILMPIWKHTNASVMRLQWSSCWSFSVTYKYPHNRASNTIELVTLNTTTQHSMSRLWKLVTRLMSFPCMDDTTYNFKVLSIGWLVESDKQLEDVAEAPPLQLVINTHLHGYLVYKWCTRTSSLRIKPRQWVLCFCHKLMWISPPLHPMLIFSFISYIYFWRHYSNHT